MTGPDAERTRDHRVPGMLIVLLITALLGLAAWLLLSNATGQPK